MSEQDSGKEPIDPSKNNGIRAEKESDRTPEYKAARETFVGDVNQLLLSVRQIQQRGDTLAVGNLHFPIQEESVVSERRLGRNPLRPELHMVQVSHNPGISLTGDGETSPLVLQAVIPGSAGSKQRIELVGTDPMASRLEDGSIDYDRQGRENVASADFVTIIESEDTASETHMRYRLSANGQLQFPRTEGITREQGAQEASLMVLSLADRLGIPPLASN